MGGAADPGHGLRFEVPFEGTPDKDVKTTAFAFDPQGNLLASALVEAGQAQLGLSPDQAARARILIGPTPPEGRANEPATIEALQAAHAYEPVWKLDRASNTQILQPIPDALWKRWLWCSCRVRGRVVRPVTIGGTTQELPICRARVHICEADRLPFLLERLPADTIARLRDELLQEIARPIPIPKPDPAPFRFDPGFVDPSPLNLALMNQQLSPAGERLSSEIERRALNPQPLPPGPDPATSLPAVARGLAQNVAGASRLGPRLAAGSAGRLRLDPNIMALNPQPLPPANAALAGLTVETRTALQSTSIDVNRKALVGNLELIRPFLCLWEWLWPWYRCDEVGVIDTDAQGRFDTSFWYLCFQDQPDLYFWVEYFIGGTWTTVYHPPLGCNIFWNYQCGTDVTLRVSDPRVPTCGDPPDLAGLQVAVLSIGDGVSMHEIQGQAAGSLEGLTNSPNPEPFGGILEPRVWFGRTALFAAGISRYRWSYRKIMASDGATAVTDVWHSFDRQVIRHYAVIDPATSGLSFPTYLLGPDPGFPGQNLYQIQPINAPAGSDGWAPIDAHEDLASGFFLTHLLAGGDADAGAGKYDLKLELFRSDGSLVNLSDAGVALKVTTGDAPFGATSPPTVDAPEEHLIRDAANKVVAFRLRLWIDNNVCHGNVIDVNIAGAGAGPCGFLEYPAGSSATLTFMAQHPHNFATYSFGVYRGSTGGVTEASAGGRVDDVSDNGFVRAGTVFSKDLAVATLLSSGTAPGETPCTKAAFAENLYVYALATDGWTRLSYLDGPRGGPTELGTKAFALELSP